MRPAPTRTVLPLLALSLLALTAGCNMDRGLYYKSQNVVVPEDYVSAISYRPADAGRFDITDKGKYTDLGWFRFKKYWGE